MSDDSAQRVRDYLEVKFNRHPEDVDAYSHAGIATDDVSDLLSFIRSYYEFDTMTDEQREVLPPTPDGARLIRLLERSQGTKQINQALEERNDAKIDAVVGQQGKSRIDFSGIDGYKKIRRHFAEKESVLQMLILGAQGAGKSNAGGRLLETWEDANLHTETKIATNIESLAKHDEFEHMWTLEQLIEFIREGHQERVEAEENGEEPPRRLVYLDECSQFLDHTKNSAKADMIGKMMLLCRKALVDFFIVGHRPVDIAPAIRDHSNLVCYKESKKKATFYGAFEKGAPAMTDEMFSVKRFPETNLPINTTDSAYFEFPDEPPEIDNVLNVDDDEDSEEGQSDDMGVQERNRRMYEKYHSSEDISYQAVADEFDISKSGAHTGIKAHEEQLIEESEEAVTGGDEMADDAGEDSMEDLLPLEDADPEDIDWDATGMDAVEELEQLLDISKEDALEAYDRAAERVEDTESEDEE